ncbi:MAG: hypothetical protein PWQ82_417 [Thermosediminibacterales bacterium]|nr:hypothetical protein [Thermosediminibacterales bacterium]
MKFRRNAKVLSLILVALITLLIAGCDNLTKDTSASELNGPIKVAAVQFNPQLNERDKNVEALLKVVTEAAQNGAKLIVTPEMATTGYYYADRKAIEPFVDTISRQKGD